MGNARMRLKRAKLLPVFVVEKARFIAASPLAVLAWGWLMRSPPRATLDSIRTLVNRALYDHSGASNNLKGILRGHWTDPSFRIMEHSVLAAHRSMRMRKVPLPTTWTKTFGWSGAINKMLKYCGWKLLGDWHWQHEDDDVLEINLNESDLTPYGLTAHNLREGWRRSICMCLATRIRECRGAPTANRISS